MVSRMKCNRCPRVMDETLLTHCRGVDEYLCDDCLTSTVEEAYDKLQEEQDNSQFGVGA